MKRYWKPNIDFRELVGLRIDRALQRNVDGDLHVILVLDDGRILVLEPEGDCCAHAYIQHVNNPECLNGALITAVDELHATLVEEDKFGVVDMWGHRIHTNHGTCVIECRTEHNGYYSGWCNIRWADSIPGDAVPLEER